MAVVSEVIVDLISSCAVKPSATETAAQKNAELLVLIGFRSYHPMDR